ncbi:taurine catabolism dioxygenase TauD [Frankia sp. CcI49]|uniref:TauD/TfdA family dioxygenase n=1 Tax=unclassified Frankia TaxID=2632575 RepID=UPI0006CA1C35|nr:MULTISPECIES: TauD/TfdA family dioxygenase [unclassified Frankia]KPM52741.1 taurine catabolism dioxygenase TauD, TfdA family protein [Frankia sp. R43]ONH57897.1 taurine catabolism dioxygenase TauD [Frankia sp. CcI49]
MEPLVVFTDDEARMLHDRLDGVDRNPYRDYPAFRLAVAGLVERGDVPGFFVEACRRVHRERTAGVADIHVLRNCPVDAEIPELGNEDPSARKHELKKTFIGEALLELFAQLTGTPLLAYARNQGDFFSDVVAIDRFAGMLTGYSDSELFFHNDRTAHEVRADYVSLLGMRCPAEDLVYTGFIDGRNLLEHLDDQTRQRLREPNFFTPFDVYSRSKNADLTGSERHPILENHHAFRYLDTRTTVAPGAPLYAKDALLEMKDAVSRATRVRHRIIERDLLVFSNQDGLHSREKIDVVDPDQVRSRWLLKTYAFRDVAARDRHRDKWLDGVPGRVAD